jgi:hypothetical protein
MSRRPLVPSRLALKLPFRPSPKALVCKAMILALVVAGLTVLGAGQALANHLRCGDTITTDTNAGQRPGQLPQQRDRDRR